jgi:uncharacterized Fe-S cluster-containing radical SAM superfamily protein
MTLFTGFEREAKECRWCGGMATLNTVCPASIGCSVCGAKPGSPCKRPSGHRAMTWHKPRIVQAESMEATP